jgi:hypothetical protein
MTLDSTEVIIDGLMPTISHLNAEELEQLVVDRDGNFTPGDGAEHELVELIGVLIASVEIPTGFG